MHRSNTTENASKHAALNATNDAANLASFFTALLDDDDDDDDDDDVLDNVDIPFFLWHTPLDDVDAMAFDDSLSNSITAPAARWFVAQRRIVVFFSLFHP